MTLDISKVKEEIKGIFGREPTRAEVTVYLLGFIHGLFVKVEQGAEVGQAPSEETGPHIVCQHCGKKTPKDAASCIYCHRKPS